MAQNATDGQREFFKQLTESKRFPEGSNLEAIRSQFATLDTKNASAWIEKALTLEDKDDQPVIAPVF